MKKVLFLLISLTMVLGAYAQEAEQLSKSELRKLEKEQRANAKAAEEAKITEQTKSMIDSRDFVLVADFIGDETGERRTVDPMFNFIIINPTSGVMQFDGESFIPRSGNSGTTFDGSITNWEANMKEKKKISWNIAMRFQSPVGTLTISFSITSDGNAQALIRGSWDGEMVYYGKIVPLSETNIQKRTPTF